MTQDPIGFAGGLNLYSYTGGNPVGSVDPSGEDWKEVKQWAARTWDKIYHAPSRALLRVFYTPPGPGVKTFKDANDFYRPHLQRAGKQIYDFSDDTLADVTNNLFFGALAVKGARAGCAAAEEASGANGARRLWQMSREHTDDVVQHSRHGKFYRHKSTQLYWTADTANHGGAIWKVYKRTGSEMIHQFDTDAYGNIIHKHKGPVGRVIPWKEFRPAEF